ncbi:Protein MARD1 [Bienertia sinuspersici]
MLRKRSRPVTNSQAIVGDHSNNSWLPPEKSTKPTSFFLNSPKFLKNFFTSCSSPSHTSTVNDPIMSPTSILDTKAFSAFANSFWVVDNNNKNPATLSATSQHSWEQPNNTKGIGLALIDENNNISNTNNSETSNSNNTSNSSNASKQHRRKLVVFGSQLRIQVPPLPPSSVFPCFSSESPREFGIKTPKNSYWPFGNKDSQVHPQESNGNNGNENGMIPGNDSLSLSDMELSEDYTCVISHGPNPKTTHIFGNCIVQSCCGVVGSSSFSSNRNGYLSKFGNSIPSHENFLSFCHHCKKKLGEGNDIYMYRGEKAFCSQECRCQEMLFDEVEN